MIKSSLSTEPSGQPFGRWWSHLESSSSAGKPSRMVSPPNIIPGTGTQTLTFCAPDAAKKKKPQLILFSYVRKFTISGYDASRTADSEEAKAVAMIRGMEAALGRGMERVMVLTDCRRLVSAFESSSTDLSWGALTLAPEMLFLVGCFLEFRFQFISRCFNFGTHALAAFGACSPGASDLVVSASSVLPFVRRRQQQQCIQTEALLAEETTHRNSSNMSSCSCNTSPIIPIFVVFLLILSTISPVVYASTKPEVDNRLQANQTFRPGEELQKLKRIRTHLRKINKSAIKTIQAFLSFFLFLLVLQSPDGDLIDCVASHQQPAFDHPHLQGQKPLDPPERPNGHNPKHKVSRDFQLWTISGESCPEGTIPIRRTKEEDILRASSLQRFGKKLRSVRRDSSSSEHEHAVGYVMGDQYYGAKASLNVWAPRVANQYEFSLSQMWVISGSFGEDLNTIEAGWQVSPELYGDNYPRFFTYWTSDAYQATGCYNLLCSGFIQTNNKIAIGAAISPTSSYTGGQFDISLLIWKDPNHGNWWLEFGSGLLVGYWPAFLFSHLRNHASMVQFGGEIINTRQSETHTSTQMGSGHFAREGFGKASYFRNLQIVDWDNSLIPLSNLKVLADHPDCYDIQGGSNSVWGNYFYYGGPGKNMKCS
ncbi:hypothetical protein GIB67_030730 [Kingdonia uniflora]|uniref:Neprosin PEP catalytic domain-containing protein n=1 Tax=Kingdonia uniflora TaxID=39325 RepID=A0A7J7L2U3_9MAGN|nr:hypothetical protein GIB67_030730 [Kingdonia uniflora]